MLFDRHRVVLALNVAAAVERAASPAGISAEQWSLFVKMERLVPSANASMREQVEALIPAIAAQNEARHRGSQRRKSTAATDEANGTASASKAEPLDSDCPPFVTPAGWERLTALQMLFLYENEGLTITESGVQEIMRAAPDAQCYWPRVVDA